MKHRLLIVLAFILLTFAGIVFSGSGVLDYIVGVLLILAFLGLMSRV